jgi:hypothetical protein
MRDPVAREFLLAFWKIHILHHAGRDRGGDGIAARGTDELRPGTEVRAKETKPNAP